MANCVRFGRTTQETALNGRMRICAVRRAVRFCKETPDLKKGLPDTIAIEKAANRITQTADKAAKTINQAAQGAPRQIRVTGDIYGFTTFYAALAYGLVFLVVVFGAWLLYNHYREQAQETVIYKQAQEVIRERDYYYSQIQDYKRNNSKYARLFPACDDKGF